MAGVALLSVCVACQRPAVQVIERVEATSGGDWEALSAAGLSQRQALETLRQALARDQRFRLLREGEAPPEKPPPTKLSLSVGLAEEDEGSVIEVRLISRRYAGDEPVRVDAVTEVPLRPSGVESPARTVVEAFEHALIDLRTEVAAQLNALDMPDRDLVKRLTAGDTVQREAALKVLTLRKNPAVLPVWLKRLEGQDPLAVRESIGALVELRDPKAVGPLIELARKKDTGFLREIIFALEIIGGEEAEGYLYTMAQGHDEPRVREAAQSALEALEARQKEPR